jgi:4-hydroxy-2-oxoheptanedioate aldolase
MRPNRLKQLWRDGKPALGVWVSTGDPYVVESLGRAGFDWVLIDMQHGMGIDVRRAVACLQALSGTEAVALVRLPWNQPEYFQWVLDAGAQGVLVPLVNAPEDARRAVQACRYPPLGNRSFGPNRARLYDPDYFERANDEVVLLVQVETREAVEQAEAIARVEGVDALYIGPADLAISMGLPPGLDVQDPAHVAACRRVLEAARAAGKAAGIHCAGPEEVVRRFQEGWVFCPAGSDIGFVNAGARRAVEVVRGTRPAEGRGVYG